MIAKNLKSKSSETQSTSKQTESTASKTESTNSKCPWKKEKKKSKFIKIFWFLNPKQLKKKDTKWLWSCNLERLELRILGSNMKVLSKGIRQVQGKVMRLEIIHKHTTSLKQHKKKKNFKDMATSSTENSENAKKKSKLLAIL